MGKRKIDGFDVHFQLDQIADAFVVAECGRVDRCWPDFGFQVLADRLKLRGDRLVVSCHAVLFQVGDRLAGLFFF